MARAYLAADQTTASALQILGIKEELVHQWPDTMSSSQFRGQQCIIVPRKGFDPRIRALLAALRANGSDGIVSPFNGDQLVAEYVPAEVFLKSVGAPMDDLNDETSGILKKFTAKPRFGISADEMMSMKFEPVRWIIPGVIPEGLSILVGSPKAGKSALILGMLIDACSGTKVLGKINCEPIEALYLALEDPMRRVVERISSMNRGKSVPGLTIVTQDGEVGMSKIGEGGEEQIEAFLDENRDCKVVVIDTWARVKPTATRTFGSQNAYDADAKMWEVLHKIANRRRIAIIAVHHTRKPVKGMKDEDWTNEVSGSQGIIGTVDTIIGFRRPRNTNSGVISIVGRDHDSDSEIVVEGDPTTKRWEMVDKKVEELSIRSDIAREIIEVLRLHGASWVNEIYGYLGCDDWPAKNSVRQSLHRMVRNDIVFKRTDGKYALVNPYPSKEFLENLDEALKDKPAPSSENDGSYSTPSFEELRNTRNMDACAWTNAHTHETERDSEKFRNMEAPLAQDLQSSVTMEDSGLQVLQSSVTELLPPYLCVTRNKYPTYANIPQDPGAECPTPPTPPPITKKNKEEGEEKSLPFYSRLLSPTPTPPEGTTENQEPPIDTFKRDEDTLDQEPRPIGGMVISEPKLENNRRSYNRRVSEWEMRKRRVTMAAKTGGDHERLLLQDFEIEGRILLNERRRLIAEIKRKEGLAKEQEAGA